MMNLADKIKAYLGRDYIDNEVCLRGDMVTGNVWIDTWNISNIPKPTQEQLDAITTPYVSKEEFNSSIQAQITALDFKRIRALAEGGTNPNTNKTYLEEYNEQIQALRDQLK